MKNLFIKFIKYFFYSFVILTTVVCINGCQENLYETIYNNQYDFQRADITYKKYESWIPAFPGQGSDKPGFITVYEHGKEVCRVDVFTLWHARDSFFWQEDRAYLDGQLIWDRKSGICSPFEPI